MGGISRKLCELVLGISCATSSAMAQQANFPIYEPTIPLVSVNREALIQKSDYGRAVFAKLAEQQSALLAENHTLTETLEKEELQLTELRKTLIADQFTPLAEAFDAKVKEVRRTQDQKSTDLAKALEAARFKFFRQAESEIGQLMQENGILFVLDESAVWMSKGGDVTELVIERLNAAYAARKLTVE
jgi:Skp family chaperone for outer membrane proteins